MTTRLGWKVWLTVSKREWLYGRTVDVRIKVFYNIWPSVMFV